MKIIYEFNDIDFAKRDMFENGQTFFLGIEMVAALKKELEEEPMLDNDELIERLEEILTQAHYDDYSC